MESTALQQAFDTCQNNKAAWLQRKNELAAAEQEYLRLLSGEGRNVSRPPRAKLRKSAPRKD